jgi:putative two-component system response regulator
VTTAASLAAAAGTQRAAVAAETARATLELATGHTDIALTRLEKALAEARKVPGALQDTLSCMILAEEEAGHAARALLHLEELSDHLYRSGIARARRLIEHAGLRDAALAIDEAGNAQAKARLISKLERPAQPESWKALQRLGVNAVLRMDETGFHGVRVGALTKALALAHGMTALQAQEIGLAAELHDVGMMSVPESILAKPGKLNDAERVLVRRHVDAGAEVLADATHPRMLLARDIAQYHHAFWDGRGFPERVGGEFIPLAARMCAIADAYDMMIAGFGGQQPRTMEQALDELHRCAGTQFDPELVVGFDEMVRSESRDLGLDLASGTGMEGFQELVASLKEDRGFL